jgi:hypothetical protein
MNDGIRCDQDKICSAGSCINDPSVAVKSKYQRILLDLQDPIYEWETECVVSKNTTQCKTSANEYDATEESCSCDVEPKIRYQWGESSDRCNCDGTPADDVPCLDTENNNMEVPDSNCGCTKPTQTNPCEPNKSCFDWDVNGDVDCDPGEDVCGGGTKTPEVNCLNTQTIEYVDDSKCSHLPKPPTTEVT